MSDLVKMSDIINIYNTYDSEEAREQVMKLLSINAVIIPDNATNGDMMKILFPDFEIRENKLSIAFWTLMSDGSYEYNSLPKEWWNAPYKKGENKGQTL